MASKFSSKLFLIFTVAFGVAVVVSAAAGLRGVRRGFEQLEANRISASIEIARHELARMGEDVDHRIAAVADSEATLSMAIDISRAQPDYSVYANDARGVARNQDLDLFEFAAEDGTIISCYQAPDRIGQKEQWLSAAADREKGAFLTRVETPQGPQVAQISVRAVRGGEKKMFLAGGRLVDKRLLQALVLPTGVRAMLYLNPDGKGVVQNLIDATGEETSAGVLAELVSAAMKQPANASRAPFPNAAAGETFYALPFAGTDGSAAAVLVLGHTAIERQAIEDVLVRQALLAAALGLLLGWMVSLWGSARISRPLEKLAASAREMAAGSAKARADESGSPEIAAIAHALNATMEKLRAERERIVQAERTAAWREMAKRAAQDLDAALERLDPAHRLSAGAILSGPLEQLRECQKHLREFGDLISLPLQTVNLNEIVRSVVRDFEPLFSSPMTEATRPPIHPEVALAENLPPVLADAALLTKAVDMLMLFAVNSMPAGGTFTLRTEATPGFVLLEISWAGAAPAPEESERGFTPAGLERRYLTGLELPSAQSIVSDHGGTMSISSASGFSHLRLQIPAAVAASEAAPEPAREHQPAD